MATDLLDQLADRDVPPPPEVLDRAVHDEINRTLLWQQAAELCLKATPWVLGHFVQAAVGVIRYTLTGRHTPRKRGDRD